MMDKIASFTVKKRVAIQLLGREEQPFTSVLISRRERECQGEEPVRK